MSDKAKTDTITVSQSDLKPVMRITTDPDVIAIGTVGCVQWVDAPAEIIEIDLPLEVAKALAMTRLFTARAVEVIGGAPFRKHINSDGKNLARLEVDGEKATLYWNERCCCEDGGQEIDRESCEFPSRLLFVSDDDLKRFRADAEQEEKMQEKLRREQWNAQQAAKTEELERSMLARLKAKYGG